MENLQIKDLKINLKSQGIELVHQEKSVVNEDFFSAIIPDQSTWILNVETKTVELTLVKENTEIWPYCLKNMENLGDYKLADEKQPDEAGKSIFTWEETKNLCRLEQQLEECDEMENEPYCTADNEKMRIMLMRMDGDTHVPTHKALIDEKKILFEVKLDANNLPAICLR